MKERVREAIGDALCQKGPRRGQLKVKPPKHGTDGAIAWHAIQLVVNPWKVSIAALVFLSADERQLFDECQAWARSIPSFHRVLDRDRKALESMGAW